MVTCRAVIDNQASRAIDFGWFSSARRLAFRQSGAQGTRLNTYSSRQAADVTSSKFDLDKQGIATTAALHWNLITAPLVEIAITRGEGILAKDGPLVVATGKHTGRSANDKFFVRDETTEDTIWWGKTNKGMTPGSGSCMSVSAPT